MFDYEEDDDLEDDDDDDQGIGELCEILDDWNDNVDRQSCGCDFIDPNICDGRDYEMINGSCKCRCHKHLPKPKVYKRCKSCSYHSNLMKIEYKALLKERKLKIPAYLK